MIKQLSSKTVYRNQWMTVREDQVEFPNGHKGIYGVVDKTDFALIIPFDGSHLYLVKQYRYPIEHTSLEFPQGKHEDDSSIPALELAKIELQEETGLLAGTIEKLGFLHEAPGYSSQGFHVFMATDLSQGNNNLDITEAGLETSKVTVKEFESLVREGKITDAPTISAYGLLQIHKIV